MTRRRKVHRSPGPVIRVLFASLLVGLGGMGIAACGTGGGDDRPRLTVLAASSLQTALADYAGTLPPTQVRQSFAGSDLLAVQIRQGARPDVYVAADTALPRRLHREGLLERPRVFASNRLVIAAPAGSGIDGLADLTAPDRSVILGDSSVPVGIYSDRLLAELAPEEREKILANTASREPEAGSITAKLVQGAADAGIVYRTDVRAVGGLLEAIPIPGKIQPRIAYAGAVVRGAPEPDLARRYLNGLTGGEGAVRLGQAGFLPPGG